MDMFLWSNNNHHQPKIMEAIPSTGELQEFDAQYTSRKAKMNYNLERRKYLLSFDTQAQVPKYMQN
jgi:hypothetical protein